MEWEKWRCCTSTCNSLYNYFFIKIVIIITVIIHFLHFNLFFSLAQPRDLTNERERERENLSNKAIWSVKYGNCSQMPVMLYCHFAFIFFTRRFKVQTGYLFHSIIILRKTFECNQDLIMANDKNFMWKRRISIFGWPEIFVSSLTNVCSVWSFWLLKSVFFSVE